MNRLLPPLPALRAFAALVRLGSVGAAAEQLHLTHGAIAHQIRALEGLLQVQLVERQGRSLILTERGRIYGYQVRQALEDIADATESTRRIQRQPLNEPAIRVSVLPSFAHHWLLPRLHSLQELHPRLRLVLHGSMDYVDPDSDTFDCAIRFGHGQWPDVILKPLMTDSTLVVASPKLLHDGIPTTLTALLRRPVLHSSENWAGWLSSMTATDVDLHRPKSRIEFTDSTHLLEAARLGLGIALTRRSIADQLLRSGEIVKAFDHERPHASRYYAVMPRRAAPNKAVDEFLEWLQRECRHFARQGRQVASF